MELWAVFCGNPEYLIKIENRCSSGFGGIFYPNSCYNHLLVISVDILLLLIILLGFSYTLYRKTASCSPHSQCFSPLLISSAVLNSGLGVVYLGSGIVIIIEKVFAKQSILPLHEWLVVLFQGTTWLSLSLTVSFMGQKVPRLFVRLCTIFAMMFAGILCISSLWEAIVMKFRSVKYVLDILSFPGAIVLLLCALKQPNCVECDTGNSNGNGGFYTPLRGDEVDFSGKDVDGSVTTPFAEAGILSTILFWWLNPLMKKGKEKILEDRDVPQLSRDDQAETCYFSFMEQLSRRKQKGSSDKLSILWVIFFSQWKALLISGFFALIKVLALATSPLLLNAFIEVAEGNESFRYEGYALAGGLFLVKCLESLSERQWYFRTRLIGLQVRSLLSAAIYQKQLRLSNDAKMTHSHGEIINYVTVDAHRIGEFQYWFHQIWTTILQLCLALVIVYYCVGLATIAALVVLVITVFGNSPFAKLQYKYQKKLMVAQDRRLKAITQALTSMKVLKLYAWETHFRKIIDGFRIEEIKWVSAVQYLQGYNVVLFWSSSILISAATFGACYFLGISLYASNVFTFLVTLRIVQEPIRYSADVVGFFIQANVSFSRIVKFLEAPEVQNRHIRQKCNGKELNQSIVIRSTEISWAPNFLKPTLRNINLSVNHGEKVAICGEVGSGKSTLLAVVLGEVPYIDGTVQVYGKIAYVSQTAWIQTGTIQENIVFGSAMDQGRYQEVLQRCSLLKDLEMLPFGDLTEIGERGINLSGGQKQRVQLARALYQDADLYLLDDPFSAVDAHTATSLFNDYVMGALSGKTVLLVTHQVDFLPAFDSILLISEGEILVAGTYDQLMASSQEFKELVNAHDEINNSEKDGDKYSFPQQPKNYKGNMKKILIEEQPTSSSVDQLIKQEERETGDTGLKPYIMYLNQNKGMLHFSLSKLVYLAFMFGQLIQNYWLAANVEDSSVSKSTLIMVYSIIGCSLILFLFLRSLCVVLLGLGASTSIFSKLMSSLFRAPMVFYDKTPVGRILSRVSSDLSTIDLVLPFKLTFTIGGIINAYFGLGVLAIFTWQISFLIILMVYLTILLQRYYFTTAKELMRINGTTKSSVVSHLAESIAGSITIRAYEAEDRFFSKNLELIDANARPFFHNFAATEWFVQRLEILCAVILSSSALAMTLFHHGTSASGFIGMALFYGLSLNIYMVYAVQNLCTLANYIVSLERLEQYMHIPSEAPEVIQGIRPALNWPTVGKVEICDLKVRYRPNAPLVLQGISCIFEGGQKIGIVGRTGSGKTTLISALFRMVEPTEGKIIIDELDISTIGLHDLRSHLGIIPQDPTLFNGSVRFNLDPLSDHNDQEIWEVLEKCQLKEAVQEKDEGLSSVVIQDGSNWSMGQRQLFCLGRALLKRSRILVLDEATASIDNATDSILQKTIRREFADCTVITVAHRIPTVMDCNMVLSISDGRVVEYDEPMKLIKTEGSLFGQLVKEYWSRSANASGLHSEDL